MSSSEPQTISFDGLRSRFETPKTYDELVAAPLSDVGDTPVPIDDLPAVLESWAAYERMVQTFVGPSGFMLFSSFNHGGWIKVTEGSDPGNALRPRSSLVTERRWTLSPGRPTIPA
jgi:hypothetical protein